MLIGYCGHDYLQYDPECGDGGRGGVFHCLFQQAGYAVVSLAAVPEWPEL